MENNRRLSASCIVVKEDKVLLVKHTYGAAAGKYLIPGGFSEDNEMPKATAEREVLEETGVTVKVNDLIAVRFTCQEVWTIFTAAYVKGEPASDQCNNQLHGFPRGGMGILDSDIMARATEVICKWIQF